MDLDRFFDDRELLLGQAEQASRLFLGRNPS